MRVRTDERRQAILDAARAVFEERGYQRASMAAISARLGGSKATLYGYFETKERLFAAAMTNGMEARGEGLLALLDQRDADIVEVLTRFGAAYLALVSSTEIVTLTRTTMAESGISDVGREVYVLGPRRVWDVVTTYVSDQMEKGRLRRSRPDFAALQFKGLLEAGILEPLLYGVEPRIDPDVAVSSAVSHFLTIYAAPEE